MAFVTRLKPQVYTGIRKICYLHAVIYSSISFMSQIKSVSALGPRLSLSVHCRPLYSYLLQIHKPHSFCRHSSFTDLEYVKYAFYVVHITADLQHQWSYVYVISQSFLKCKILVFNACFRKALFLFIAHGNAAYVAFVVIQSQSCFVDFHVSAIKFICIMYVYSKINDCCFGFFPERTLP